MPERADDTPRESKSCDEKNEDDINTSRAADMSMGTRSGTQAKLLMDSTEPYLMELRKIFVRKLLATCTSFSEGIL